MATHSSVLAWRIPWTEEPGGLQSVGSQRDGHDRATFTPLTVFAATCICRSSMPSVHRMLTNAHGGMLPTCPAITAESDGFRGRLPSIFVLPVPLSDGGGRQGPDLGTDSLGERRPWTSSYQTEEVIAFTVFSFIHLFPRPVPFSGSGMVVPEDCAVSVADLGGCS